LNMPAGETFRLNFPEATFFEGPVSLLPAKRVLEECSLGTGELDCLIGGPPCQSFSYNNHNRSATDARARLFDEYLRLVADLRPKMIVMENVPGILTIGDGSVISEITSRLAELGYDSSHRMLSSNEYGVPQIRKRVFVVASRIGQADSLLPVPTHKAAAIRTRGSEKSKKVKKTLSKKLKNAVTIACAFSDLPVLRNGGGSHEVVRPKKTPTNSYQKEMRKSAKLLYNHVCNRLGELMLERIEHIPEGGNWRDIPFELLPAGMQRAKPSDHTKRYGRLKRSGLASTLLTKCDPHWGAYIHPTQRRTISVREAARLQGFPDRFRFAGKSLTSHYEQIGNAVPVQVARAIAASISKSLTKSSADVRIQRAEVAARRTNRR
jgi:DNA (cytosine-5)-methyltransferase 1